MQLKVKDSKEMTQPVTIQGVLYMPKRLQDRFSTIKAELVGNYADQPARTMLAFLLL